MDEALSVPTVVSISALAPAPPIEPLVAVRLAVAATRTVALLPSSAIAPAVSVTFPDVDRPLIVTVLGVETITLAVKESTVFSVRTPCRVIHDL